MTPTIHDDVSGLIQRLDGAVRLHGDGVEVSDPEAVRAGLVDELVWTAVFGDGETRDAARWLIRVLAPAMGAWPASIHDLYMAAGRREYADVTTPAINLRGMAYDLARTVFRAGHATQSKQILLELARSEMGYTDQRPAEYASVVLAAAIKEVSVDFDTLANLSRAAKDDWGMGGAVQHGASTLPESAFSRFADADAVEVHLATAFQNAIYDSEAFPADLKEEIYAHLAKNLASERKPNQTDTQFYYTTRKQGFGPFKRQFWSMPEETKATILGELQPRFELIMHELRVAGRGELVDRYVKRVDVDVPAPEALLSRLG